jgi:hypothetical protein
VITIEVLPPYKRAHAANSRSAFEPNTWVNGHYKRQAIEDFRVPLASDAEG